MKKQFELFKQWLEVNYKKGLEDLNNPITEEEISILECGLGFALPLDLIEILKIHNGQNRNAGWIFEGQEFLSSHRILDEWKVWKELLDDGDFDDNKSGEVNPEIKDNWWNEKWIPFTYNGCGDHYCLDMDPTNIGKKGQIITMWHDDAKRELLNNSLYSWFQTYVSKLNAGEFIYSEEYDSIIDKNDI